MGGYMTLRYANPGALHHARWVTLYSRGLCYYVSQKEPTRELVRDVTFAVRIYIPGWFLTIKGQSFIKGPRILQQVVANGRGELLRHGGEVLAPRRRQEKGKEGGV